MPAAGNDTDCYPCPAGYYCNYTNGTVSGEKCKLGEYCPEGAVFPVICPAGEELIAVFFILD